MNVNMEQCDMVDDGDGVIDFKAKIKYDRRMYDLNTFSRVLSKVNMFDYRSIDVTNEEIRAIEISFDKMKMEEAESSSEITGKTMPKIDYNDKLTSLEVAHVVDIFSR